AQTASPSFEPGAQSQPMLSEQASEPAPIEVFEIDLDQLESYPTDAAAAPMALVDELPQAIEISFDELPADLEFPLPAAEAADEPRPAAMPEPVEIEGIDLSTLTAMSGAVQIETRAEEQTGQTKQAEPQPDMPSSPVADGDDQVKVIGPLRIGIPL